MPKFGKGLNVQFLENDNFKQGKGGKNGSVSKNSNWIDFIDMGTMGICTHIKHRAGVSVGATAPRVSEEFPFDA